MNKKEYYGDLKAFSAGPYLKPQLTFEAIK